MNNKKYSLINDYAKSMFFFENLNDRWILKCKKYLLYIFKNKIKNSVIVDYAFGRGNWAIAFYELGAKKVIAVDKSNYNVIKLKKYLKKKSIKNIKVIKGDILNTKILENVDIFWIYGIFHHLKNIKKFILLLRNIWKKKEAIAMVYAYNNNSLREIVINFSRKYLKFKNYKQFLNSSYYFSHSSRLRIRDDLVVDHIKWYSQKELIDILKKYKFYGIKFCKSFENFNGIKSSEFNAHHLLISKKKKNSSIIPPPKKNKDLIILLDLLNLISIRIKSKKILKKFSIGLLNTHFNGDNSNYNENFKRVLLFIFYIIKIKKITPQTKNQNNLLFKLENILKNENFLKIKKDTTNNIFRYLSETGIRI